MPSELLPHFMVARSLMRQKVHLIKCMDVSSVPHLPSVGNTGPDCYNCCSDLLVYPQCALRLCKCSPLLDSTCTPQDSRDFKSNASIWSMSLPLLSKAWDRSDASCCFLTLHQMKKHQSTLMKRFVLVKLKTDISCSPIEGIAGMAQVCRVLLSWFQLKTLRGASLRKFKRSSINHVYI